MSHKIQLDLEHSDHCQINLAYLCSVGTYWNEDFIFLRTELNNGASFEKAQEESEEEQPAAPAAQNIPTGGYLWTRDEEKLLVDYEPEEPAAFSPMEDDISVVGEDLSPLQMGKIISPQLPTISR